MIPLLFFVNKHPFWIPKNRKPSSSESKIEAFIEFRIPPVAFLKIPGIFFASVLSLDNARFSFGSSLPASPFSPRGEEFVVPPTTTPSRLRRFCLLPLSFRIFIIFNGLRQDASLEVLSNSLEGPLFPDLAVRQYLLSASLPIFFPPSPPRSTMGCLFFCWLVFFFVLFFVLFFWWVWRCAVFCSVLVVVSFFCLLLWVLLFFFWCGGEVSFPFFFHLWVVCPLVPSLGIIPRLLRPAISPQSRGRIRDTLCTVFFFTFNCLAFLPLDLFLPFTEGHFVKSRSTAAIIGGLYLQRTIIVGIVV